MEEEQEKSKGFKVEDRRRFSAEGEPRPEYQPEQKDQPQAAPTETPKPPKQEKQGEARSGSEVEITFPTFVVSLSTQALVHLGEIPDPVTGQAAPDLEAAQQIIDILSMMEHKTRGNLEPDEKRLLDSILFDLRIKYVELTRRP